MSTTATRTETYTHTVADIEKVFRRFSADIKMIAESTGAMTLEKAEQYGHDIQFLAARGYIKWIDVTLMSNSTEICAVKYTVVTGQSDMSSDRPGGVAWSRVSGGRIRVTISHTSDYTDAIASTLADKLKISWSESTADLSHKTLTTDASRQYSSKDYGLTRQGFSR
ncbi:hypothetical protein [Burkholderia gladioli]|uniref:HORMA-1 domain-containing protein n=1 Tax=Burkholderia gladioli TaxID=28095 RepID=UPI0016415D59|nr:hypothetical protein [Burkholderia gladioli]